MVGKFVRFIGVSLLSFALSGCNLGDNSSNDTADSDIKVTQGGNLITTSYVVFAKINGDPVKLRVEVANLNGGEVELSDDSSDNRDIATVGLASCNNRGICEPTIKGKVGGETTVKFKVNVTKNKQTKSFERKFKIKVTA